jgi:hypothetical protein
MRKIVRKIEKRSHCTHSHLLGILLEGLGEQLLQKQIRGVRCQGHVQQSYDSLFRFVFFFLFPLVSEWKTKKKVMRYFIFFFLIEQVVEQAEKLSVPK